MSDTPQEEITVTAIQQVVEVLSRQANIGVLEVEAGLLLRSIAEVVVSLSNFEGVSGQALCSTTLDNTPLLASIENVTQSVKLSCLDEINDNSVPIVNAIREVVHLFCVNVANVYPPAGPSILRTIGRLFDENLHSDILAALLDGDASGEFAQILFDFLFSATGKRPGRVPSYQFAKREVPLHQLDTTQTEAGQRRIDVLVVRPKAMLVIENKLLSSESFRQTDDYAAAVTRAYAAEGIKKDIAMLLLSPLGTPPANPRFVGISYTSQRDFVAQSIERVGDQAPPMATFYLNELNSLVRRFYKYN